MAKVNYQYEKRQKELAKKRKKEQKQKLKELKKNSQLQGGENQESENTQDVPESQKSTPAQQTEK